MEDKKSIRSEVRRRIKLMSEDDKQTAARAIFEAVEATAEFNDAECVALFAAMWDEVPTNEALERWRILGKRVVVPRVEGDIMRYYPYSPDQMREGAFGIMEPVGDVEVEPSAIDLMIVPARAFTPRGERLGRGGGFYDNGNTAGAVAFVVTERVPCHEVRHSLRLSDIRHAPHRSPRHRRR